MEIGPEMAKAEKRDSAVKLWMGLQEVSRHYGIPIPTIKSWNQKGWLTEPRGWHHFGKLVRINTVEFEAEFLDKFEAIKRNGN